MSISFLRKIMNILKWLLRPAPPGGGGVWCNLLQPPLDGIPRWINKYIVRFPPFRSVSSVQDTQLIVCDITKDRNSQLFLKLRWQEFQSFFFWIEKVFRVFPFLVTCLICLNVWHVVYRLGDLCLSFSFGLSENLSVPQQRLVLGWLHSSVNNANVENYHASLSFQPQQVVFHSQSPWLKTVWLICIEIIHDQLIYICSQTERIQTNLFFSSIA